MTVSSLVLPFVRVVVLNWNSAWFTSRCVESLLATDYPQDRLEIVLVDNGSLDGSLELLKRRFPDLSMVANQENYGFSEGCNVAMRERSGVDYIALVNNDAWVNPDWLRPLVATLENQPGAGAAAAKLLLEPRFARVDLTADFGDSPTREAELVSVVVDGLDVSHSVRSVGLRCDPAVEWTMQTTLHLENTATLWIPVDGGGSSASIRFDGGTVSMRSEAGEAVAKSGRSAVVELGAGAQLVNGLGTGMNEWMEGMDLHFGERDERVDASPDALGFCGGGALLRSAALDETGLFDPKFFAYYEDTDLSWRMRRKGWSIAVVPEARVMHAFGGSGGARSEGFFYLDRRNWLLTSLRNGDRAQVKAVCRLALGRALRAFRGNVTGKIRRGDAPSLRLVSTWGRILLSVAARAGTLRSTKTPGARAPKRVRSFLQPSGGIPSPQRRPGGPQVVYVDVSSVLESGEPRSSEAQAVSDLILGGKFSNPSIELVPVVKSADGLGTRRVTNTEMAILLGSGEHPNRTTSTAELAELSVHPQSGTFLAVASGKRLEITPVEISCDSGQGDPPERFTIEGSGDGTGLAAELAAKLGQ